jgi:hypothetical protein
MRHSADSPSGSEANHPTVAIRLNRSDRAILR